MRLFVPRNNERMITEKKGKKGKKKDLGERTRTILPPPPAIEISTPREIIATSPHSPFFSHDGYCLGIDVKPSSLLLYGLGLPSLGFSLLFVVDSRS